MMISVYALKIEKIKELTKFLWINKDLTCKSYTVFVAKSSVTNKQKKNTHFVHYYLS